MNIGTLTGNIELEDQLSSALTIITSRVKAFAEGFNNVFGTIAIGAGVAITAILGVGATIMSLATAGSTINDVESAFDRLAKQAGSTGDALINSLSKGVRGTVDSMVLMQSTSRVLQAGMKLTEKDMELIGATARAMGKSTGTDATNGLNMLSQALITGQTRLIKRAGIVVDVTKAEKALADRLGVTTQQLSQAGKVEAARTAIMEAARVKLEQLGQSQMSFKEKLTAASVSIGNWFDNLKKGIDKSAAVNKALDDISKALVKAFGDSSQTLLKNILNWVDLFAGAVSRYGPPIIEWVSRVWQGVQDIWEAVTKAWNLVPDWFKNIAKEAALAGGALYLVKESLKGIASGGGGGKGADIGSIATTISGFRDSLALVAEQGSKVSKAFRSVIETLQIVAILGIPGVVLALKSGMGVVAAFFGSWPVLIAGAVFAIYKLTGAIGEFYAVWKRGDSVWNNFAATLGSVTGIWLPMSNHINTTRSALEKFNPVAAHTGSLLKDLVNSWGDLSVHNAPPVPPPNPLDLINQKEIEDQRRKILQESLAKELSMRTFFAGMRNRQRDSENEQILNDYLTNLAHIEKLYAENLEHEVQMTRVAWTAKNKASDDAAMVAYNNIVEHYDKVEKYSSATLRNEAREAQKTYKFMAAHAGDFSRGTIRHFKEVAEEARRTALGIKGSLSTSLQDLGRAFETLAEISGGTFGGIAKDIGEFIATLNVAEQAGKGMKVAYEDLGDAIDRIGEEGVTGADSVGEISTAMADLAVSAMAAYGAMQKATDSMSRAKNVASGAATGAKIGSQVAGGYGAVVGAIAGAVWGWVKSNTIESRLVSPIRDAFFEMEGGLERLNPLLMVIDGNMAKVQAVLDAKTPQAYEAAVTKLKGAMEKYNEQMKVATERTGTVKTKMQDLMRLTPELELALGRVYDAQNVDDYVEALGELNGLLDEQKAKQDFLIATLDKYGLAWTDVGKAGRDQMAAVKAGGFKAEFDALKEAGVDVNNIWRHMGDSFSDFILEAKKSGTEIPESLKGVLQTAIDAGEIFTVSTDELTRMKEEAEKLGKPFDDTKYKVDTLEEAGVTFGVTMETAMGKVTTAIDRLIIAIETRLAPAINAIPDVDVSVRSHIDPNDDFGKGGINGPEYAATGGYVTQNNVIPFRPRGSDTVPAMLTPGETVLPAGMRAGGGGGTVIINVDGKKLAELVVPELPGVVKRYGLGRR